MSNEDIPIEIVNKLCKDYIQLVGEDSSDSFFDIIKARISESIRQEYEYAIEEKVIPLVRNLEIQSACQVSKSNEFYSEVKKITDQLALQISKLSDQINLLKSNSSQQLEKIELAMKHLNRKADIYELQALSKEVSNMTPLNTFYHHQEWTQTLASKTDIIRVDNDLIKIRELINDCPTIDQMLNEHAKIIVDMKSEISKEKLNLIAKINELKELLSQYDEKIEFLKNKMQQNNDILSKRITENMDYVLEKPWADDANKILKKVKKKAPYKEIQDLRDLMEPKLVDFLKKFEDISTELSEYTSVMARFDEVILTKASKDDLKLTQKKINNMVLQSTLDPILTEITDKLKLIENLQNFQSSALEETKKEIYGYTLLISSQKAHAKDFAIMSESIKSITESLTHKADKTDIYSLFDVMGYRDDIINLSTLVQKIKDLFHQGIVLQHEAISTFILSGDSPVTKNKRRLEIIKNLEFLLKKITMAQEKSIQNIHTAGNSKKKLNSMTSIHLENLMDDKNLSSRTMSHKTRRVSSAVSHKRNSVFLVNY